MRTTPSETSRRSASRARANASVAASVVRGENYLRLTDDAIHGHAWAGLIEEMPETAAAAAPFRGFGRWPLSACVVALAANQT